MIEMNTSDWISRKELAKRLNISLTALRNAEMLDKIPGKLQLTGRTVRWHLPTVMAWVTARMLKTAS